MASLSFRFWEEGKILIFDDSFEHEVWQDADAYRLIFIVDVWHPELTSQQRRSLPAIWRMLEAFPVEVYILCLEVLVSLKKKETWICMYEVTWAWTLKHPILCFIRHWSDSSVFMLQVQIPILLSAKEYPVPYIKIRPMPIFVMPALCLPLLSTHLVY